MLASVLGSSARMILGIVMNELWGGGWEVASPFWGVNLEYNGPGEAGSNQ